VLGPAGEEEIMAEHDQTPDEQAAAEAEAAEGDEKRLEDLELSEEEAADVKGGMRTKKIEDLRGRHRA
jgi:hypothetical protein